MEQEIFSSPLDKGIECAVRALRAGGIETFESCEGGLGHAYAEPTVRFHGNQAEGFKALAVAMHARLPVTGLRRVWPVLDNEPTGPWWELTFCHGPIGFGYGLAAFVGEARAMLAQRSPACSRLNYGPGGRSPAPPESTEESEAIKALQEARSGSLAEAMQACNGREL